MGDGEAEPHALLFGAKKWTENFLLVMVGDAHAGIDKFYGQISCFVGKTRSIFFRFGGDGKFPALGHCLHGVLQQIKYYLLEQLRVPVYFGVKGVIAPDEINPALPQGRHDKGEGFVEKSMEVNTLKNRILLFGE